MSSTYLNSNQIRVFPTSKRNQEASGDTYSRYFTEYAITNIINRLVNEESFVITKSNSTASFALNTLSEFEINLGGYYFNFNVQSDEFEELVKRLNNSTRYINVTAKIQVANYGEKSLVAITNPASTPTNAIDSLDGILPDKTTSTFNALEFTPASSYTKTKDIVEEDSGVTTITYTMSILQYVSGLFNLRGQFIVPLQSQIRFKSPILSIDDGEL